MNTPPADEPNDNGAKPKTDEIAGPLTEPRPTTYYAPPLPANQGKYPGAVPVPPYPQPIYASPDTQRGLRAASRLALATDLLNGGAILWVDDHPEWNEALARLFRSAGIRVDTAVSTDDAMSDLARSSYDLVISDLGRPNEPDGGNAGVNLVDRMVAASVPTPVAIFSDVPAVRSLVHPRIAVATNMPEELVDTVVDFVGTRRSQQSQSSSSSSSSSSSWIDRLQGN
ncbi:response regulator [Glycomyces mayteni]|nr:hypothetical protein GCM10025732_49690 [Glycomyces mayteni]